MKLQATTEIRIEGLSAPSHKNDKQRGNFTGKSGLRPARRQSAAQGITAARDQVRS